MDRQPSGPSCSSSSGNSSTGLTRWPSTSSTSNVNTRRPTPICGAARPVPFCSRMVSRRSSTRRRSSLSKSTTGSAGVRKTGSPKIRTFWTVKDAPTQLPNNEIRSLSGLPGVVLGTRLLDVAPVLLGPAGEGDQRLVELLGHRRQAVFDLGRHRRVDGADQQAVALEVAQGQGQHPPADALHGPLELGEPDRTASGGDDDADAPLAADPVDHLADRAHLVDGRLLPPPSTLQVVTSSE